MLRENKTLKSLNLETNFITGAGVKVLVEALRDNDTLSEIKIENQVQHRNSTTCCSKTIKLFIYFYFVDRHRLVLPVSNDTFNILGVEFPAE